MKVFILISMLFCHIVDDYYLQGWLAQAKQKKWWEKNAPDKLYKNDYKMALTEHGFSWTFMVHLPIMVFWLLSGGVSDSKVSVFCIYFIVNWVIHVFVDDLKANKLKINLVVDQSIHFIQVLITWFVLVVLF